jgi:hypothetical protein
MYNRYRRIEVTSNLWARAFEIEVRRPCFLVDFNFEADLLNMSAGVTNY